MGMKTAVIGAGIAGIVTARELKREGHEVTVFEKASKLGGTWVYDPRTESDPIGLDPNREVVHSSLYLSLRTNLPRDLMGFSDYPFLVKANGDPRNFPGHQEFLSFLNDFARDFEITELIRFNSEVIGVERNESNDGGWSVDFRGGADGEMGSSETEVFEAVVICNGHQTTPKLADPPGLKSWKGKQFHSHNYRIPQPFMDLVVVMIGHGPSAIDISVEVASVAKEVHLSSRLPDRRFSKTDGFENMWNHSEIEFVEEERGVVFKDGSSVRPDVIFHCTGYKYDFPFLKTNGIVTSDDNRVGPLYKHVFASELGPSLSFVGLNNLTIVCRVNELQAKWVAKILSGVIVLPSKEAMMENVREYYNLMEERGMPKRRTHFLPWKTSEYMDWLADEVGSPRVEDRLKQMFCNVIDLAFSCGSPSFIAKLRDG